MEFASKNFLFAALFATAFFALLPFANALDTGITPTANEYIVRNGQNFAIAAETVTQKGLVSNFDIKGLTVKVLDQTSSSIKIELQNSAGQVQVVDVPANSETQVMNYVIKAGDLSGNNAAISIYENIDITHIFQPTFDLIPSSYVQLTSEQWLSDQYGNIYFDVNENSQYAIRVYSFSNWNGDIVTLHIKNESQRNTFPRDVQYLRASKGNFKQIIGKVALQIKDLDPATRHINGVLYEEIKDRKLPQVNVYVQESNYEWKPVGDATVYMKKVVDGSIISSATTDQWNGQAVFTMPAGETQVYFTAEKSGVIYGGKYYRYDRVKQISYMSDQASNDSSLQYYFVRNGRFCSASQGPSWGNFYCTYLTGSASVYPQTPGEKPKECITKWGYRTGDSVKLAEFEGFSTIGGVYYEVRRIYAGVQPNLSPRVQIRYSGSCKWSNGNAYDDIVDDETTVTLKEGETSRTASGDGKTWSAITIKKIDLAEGSAEITIDSQNKDVPAPTPTPIAAKPSAPSNLNLNLAGDDQIKLSWQAVSDAQYYEVYLNINPEVNGQNFYKYATTYTPEYLHQLGGASWKNNHYRYYVTAINAQGTESDPSNIVEETEEGGTTQPTVQNMTFPTLNVSSTHTTTAVNTVLPKEYTVQLKQGWNLLAPRNGRDVIASTDCNAVVLWTYDAFGKKYDNSGYLAAGTTLPANAFWAKVPQTTCSVTVTQSGSEISAEGINLAAGWNMIPGTNSDWSTIHGNCEAVSGPYYFDGGWNKVQYVFSAGLGYFIKVKNACTLGSDFPQLPNE